jgi:nanoRNase/pAp phosphatase (c-di-AMP/oligoRNAs hydrolase)
MVNDLCERLLKDENFDYVFSRNPNNGGMSVRMKVNDGPVHIGNILKKLKLGGGHKEAGGINSMTIQDAKLAIEKVTDEIIVQANTEKYNETDD